MTSIGFAFVNVSISGGVTAGAAPGLGSTVTPCNNHFTLGRQKTTVNGNQLDIRSAEVVVVASTLNFASSGRLFIFTGNGNQPTSIMTYTGTTATEFTGLDVEFNTGGYAVNDGDAVTGTSTGADTVPTQDIILNPTIWDPTSIYYGGEAPQPLVEPPADFVIFQMGVSGDGTQRMIGDISVSINSQLIGTLLLILVTSPTLAQYSHAFPYS